MGSRSTQNDSSRALVGAVALLLASSTPAGAALNLGNLGIPGFPGGPGLVDPGPGIVHPVPTPIPPPPPPPPTPQLKSPTLTISERTSNSLTLGWCDRSSIETGNHVWRTTNGEATLSGDIAFTGGDIIANLPAEPNGCREYVDGFSVPEVALSAESGRAMAFNLPTLGLPADSRFCYQVVPHRYETEFGDYLSAVSCAYTRESPSRTIWRAQIQLRTAAGGSNGTDDAVSVALNRRFLGYNNEHLVGWEKPFGNETWLDRPGDDHEPGSVEVYDLNLGQIGDMGDITQISIRKSGDDAWCLDGAALIVNDGVTVFETDFDSCHLAENEYVLSIPHAELRAAASWQGYQPSLIPADAAVRLLNGQSVPIIEISRGDLESIVEGIVGHEIHGKKLEWGKLEGSRFVEVSPIDDQTVGVDLDLKVVTPISRDPKVDIDFDLRFDMSCSPTGVDFGIETLNFEVDADTNWFTQFLGFLYCGVVDPSCKPNLESFIEGEVRRKFKPLAKSMSIDLGETAELCGSFFVPVARITDAGGLVIEVQPGPPLPTPVPTASPQPTPTPAPIPTAKPAIGILTSALQLKDDVSPPINPDTRRLVFRSTGSPSTPSGVVEPIFGSPGDPTTAGGAELVVYKVNGAPENVATVALPAQGWKRIGTDASPGYQYNDPKRLDGPVTNVRVRNGNLTIRGNGEGLLELSGAPQEEVALRLRLGAGDTWCAVAPAKAPVGNNDTTARFNGQPGSPPPASCPVVPGEEDSVMEAFLSRPADLLR